VARDGTRHVAGAGRRGATAPRSRAQVTTALDAPSVGTFRSGRLALTGLTERARRRVGYALLAALSYVPLLLTAPGRVGADTKQYLYLDPGRLLERAPSMWDPSIGFGSVTHQNIGYLFPMGPFYWFFDAIGIPDWVAQRLWLGTIILFAGLGVLYLLRTLGVRGPGVVAAALVYMLSPYLLDFSARISVILLPFAGLPWMIGLIARALRSGRWREPAAFAIVVQIVGGVNATALVFAGLGAALWIPYAVWVAREIDWRRALTTTVRIGVLTLGASLWWIAGLSIQSGYGLNVLRYTETLEVVSRTSTVPELLRGLGYWFFYGRDRLGPWIESSTEYTQHIWLIVVGFAIPTLALLGATCTRWKHKIFFVGLVFVGMVLAVGAYPYDDASPYGRAFRSFARDSTAGFALRSTGRAVPLIALGLAVLLGVGVNALAARLAERGHREWGLAIAALVGVLAIVNMPALWNGNFYGKNLQRPEDVPGYWQQAIAALDRRPHDTRILELPGSDFSSYRWGETVDPITPGLTDRPYVARELIPYGTPPSADLLNAFDVQLQDGSLEAAAIAPVARLMSVGDVVLRSDLQVDRYNIARPRPTWLLFTPPPPGLGEPRTYGTSLGKALRFPQIDELALALPTNAPTPPPVSVFPVKDTTRIVRASPVDQPLLVSGDGAGLVDVANVGLLADQAAILYSASYADHAAALRGQLGHDAVLVVTDSNRKRAERWTTVHDIFGHTERADEHQLGQDEGDNRLPVFPDAGTDAYTVVQQRGAKVDASREGNRITYEPENRGARAFDGDLDTAWIVGESESVIGEHVRLTLPKPITTDRVNLVQPLVGPRDRFITKVTLTFDGRDELTVPLGDSSRTDAGQTIRFPKRAFRRLDIRVDDTNSGARTDLFKSGVGFAEIRVRDSRPGATDVHVDEIVRMPTDLTEVAGPGARAHRLVYVMTRSRNRLVPPRYSEDELALVRKLEVPDARTFSLRGTARISSAVADQDIDRLLGFPSVEEGGMTARSSARLPGDLRARASSAVDGDSRTAWTSAFQDTTSKVGPAGSWVEIALPGPVTFDHLGLQVVADGRYSVPTRVRIEAGGQSRDVDVPAVTDRKAENAAVPAPVSFPALTGSTIRVTVEAIRPVRTTEYYSNEPVVMPVAVAELGIPGVTPVQGPRELPATCRDGLLTVDGRPISVRAVGDRATAEARGALDLQPCDAAGRALRLDRGAHLVRSTPGKQSGVDVDSLVVASEAGGAPLALGVGGDVPAVERARPTPPRIRVDDRGRTHLSLHVSSHDAGRHPFWVVLGESRSVGWTASVNGHDLGQSQLIDGYANGWLVRPDGRDLDITLDWTPQQRVWIALALSGLTMMLCTALALGILRRRNREPSSGPRDAFAAPEPALDNPLVLRGERPSTAVLMGAPIGAAVVAGIVTHAWLGLLTGALVLLVLLRPRWRFVLSLGAVGAIAAAGFFTAVQQLRYEYPPVLEWPQHFDKVHLVGWVAVVFLVADTLVQWLLSRDLHSRRPQPREVDGLAPD